MEYAVILCGGQGRRIWPYSATQDKLMLPAGGRPAAVPTLETLAAEGFQRIVMVGNRRGWQQLNQYLAANPGAVDRGTLVFVEDRGQGSAASLALGLTAVPAEAEEVLVVCGDTSSAAENIRNLISAHEEQKPAASALVHPLRDPGQETQDRSGDWLCAAVSGGRVTKVLGHPRSDVNYRLTGCYVFSRSVFAEFERTAPYMEAVQVGMMPPAESEAAQTVANLLAQGLAITAVHTADYFVDLDKPWHLLEAAHRRLDYLKRREDPQHLRHSPVSVADDADIEGPLYCGDNVVIGSRVVIRGPVWIGSGTTITNGAMIHGPVWIGPECRLEDYCTVGSYSTLGRGCRVGHCAEIDGVLMDNVYAVHYMEFAGVIGRSSDLGAATVCGTLRFDDGDTAIAIQGRREKPGPQSNAAFLGDFTRTGVNAVLMPGIRVGAYGIVGPGVVLQEDVPDGTMVMVEQSLHKRAWGPEKYGW